MESNSHEFDAFLFNHMDQGIGNFQKSPLLSRFPNPSNKTGEDLQELIEDIPYPTEELSLTSFSNSSSNTNALKRSKPNNQEKQAKAYYYTSFGSEHQENPNQKTPLHIRFDRYHSQQQQQPIVDMDVKVKTCQESFDDEDNDDILSNLPNFESLTPHRINQIMDWSKQHVTPGDSKNIFPQVIAPSIEFSHENSTYLSKCVLTEQNEINPDIHKKENKEGKAVDPRGVPQNKKNFGNVKENIAVGKEKNKKNHEQNQNWLHFEDNAQEVSSNLLRQFNEKPKDKMINNIQNSNENVGDSLLRIDNERLRVFCERMSNEIQAKNGLLHKKEQETNTLVETIKDLEEEISLLREKTQENGNLELLRGKNLESSRKETKMLKKEIENKQNYINELHAKINELESNLENFQISMEKEMSSVYGEIEKHKALSVASKRKANDLENQLKQVLDQKEMENTELERKLEALSQGYEDLCLECDSLKEEKHSLLQEQDAFKKRIMDYENENQTLKQENTLFKQKEEILYQNEKNGTLCVEKPAIIEDLQKEVDIWKKKHNKLNEELEDLKTNKEQDNTRISLNKLILTEASFGKNEIKSGFNLMSACDHKSQLEGFFVNIGYKEEGVDTLENKSFEDLMVILNNVFNHLQEQFESLYHERNEFAENLEKIQEDLNNKSENNQEKTLMISENQRLQDLLTQKMNEILTLKEQNLRIKEELVKKCESLEVLEVRQKSSNPEILVRNSESFQIMSQQNKELQNKNQEIMNKNQESLIKIQELTYKNQEYQEKISDLMRNQNVSHKIDELLQKNQELTSNLTEYMAKNQEVSDKYSNLLQQYNEKTKEIEGLLKERLDLKQTLENNLENSKNELDFLRNELNIYKNQANTVEKDQKKIENELINSKKELNNSKNELNLLKNELFMTKKENSLLKSSFNEEKAVSETNRLKAEDYSKQLEVLNSENEELKRLLSQQGIKIEEFTKLLAESLDNKEQFNEDTERIIRENETLIQEKEHFLQEKEIILQEHENVLREKEEIFKEFIEIKEKCEGIYAENNILAEEIAIKNEQLRKCEEISENLKEKDKKNIHLFKENKSLLENIKRLEEINLKDKQELDRKTKLLTQKSQETKSLLQENKILVQNLNEEKKKFEDYTYEKKDQKEKENSNLNRFCNKVKENEQELKEIKKLFIIEQDKLMEKVKEVEILKEKILEENVLLKENKKKSKEKILVLEKNLKDLNENYLQIKKNAQNLLYPEMLSNEETVEMMLELLRRIIGSTNILKNLNENDEIVILLKKLLRNLNGATSLDNSKVISRKIYY